MCVVNSIDKGNYEVIVSDLGHFPICSIYFVSISTVCRFVQDFDFEHGMLDIYRRKDMQFIDSQLLMELWSDKNEISY